VLVMFLADLLARRTAATSHTNQPERAPPASATVLSEHQARKW
jgi:hypothetical protein